jgi:hypothetical protein
MSITEIGRQGEQLARTVLKETFKVDDIFQADWLVKAKDNWHVIEVKHKELFKPPPFYGQGLDIRQVKARLKFQKDTGIRCLFLVIESPSNKVYWQWLDVLEQTKYIDTKNAVRIYDIKNFKNINSIVPCGAG